MGTAYWVRRESVGPDPITGAETLRVGWNGPHDDGNAAQREAAAWQSCGWNAEVLPDSEGVRATVAEWEERTVASWKDSTDPSQRRRYWDREQERRSR